MENYERQGKNSVSCGREDRLFWDFSLFSLIFSKEKNGQNLLKSTYLENAESSGAENFQSCSTCECFISENVQHLEKKCR